MERDNDLDRLLDAALSSYVKAEPREGFGLRIAAEARASRAQARVRWQLWAAAPALAAMLAGAVMLERAPRHASATATARVEAPEGVVRPTLQGDSESVRAQPASGKDGRRSTRSGGLRRLPKRKMFPEMAPLTEQERALVAIARDQPEAARSLAAAQEAALQPLEIQPVETKPLADASDLQ
jgi:hypothetical protein